MNALLTEREVVALVRLSRATVRRLEAAGKFPARRRLSPGRVAWLSEEVMQWISNAPMAQEVINVGV